MCPADNMQAMRLTASVGAWSAKARSRREHERAVVAGVEGLELVSPDGGALVYMAAENQLRAGGCERAQHIVAVLEGEFARRTPGSAREMVVENDDAECVGGCVAQRLGCGRETSGVEPATLVTPRTGRVETANDRVVGAQHGIRRPEHGSEPIPGAREPRRHGVRKVVIARHDERGGGKPVEQRLHLLELRRPATVCQVTACDHELGRELFTKSEKRVVESGHLACATVEVGDMDEAACHRRLRLYTGRMSEQSPEIFDDLYLGLQAGGALRKQRRGEELTEQEQAALGHWQRLSVWRKALAVGAFSLGTFGLGFTLGGLIFGRRRAT